MKKQPKAQKAAKDQPQRRTAPLSEVCPGISLDLGACEAAMFLLEQLESGDLCYLNRWDASREEWNLLGWLQGMAYKEINKRLAGMKELLEEASKRFLEARRQPLVPKAA